MENVSDIDPVTAKAPAAERAASAAHSAIDTAAAKAAQVEQQVRKKMSDAGDKVEATQVTASKQIEKSIKQLEEFAKARPIAATGIAFAAGILAAALLRK